MGIRNAGYWFNSTTGNGPTEGGLVKEDGTVVRFTYDWNGRATFNAHRGDAVAFVIPAAKDGTWTAEGNHPAHNGTLWSTGHATAEEAAAAWLAKREEEAAKEAAVVANPEAHLERELARHDWYSHYSDDFGVARAGDRHWDLIVSFKETVGEERWNELVAKYAPKEG